MKNLIENLKSDIKSNPAKFCSDSDVPVLDTLYWHYCEDVGIETSESKTANSNFNAALESMPNFLYRMDLPHRAVAVYIYLSDRANKNGECWPAIPTIANELKLSQSTVRRALRDLRKAGLLETQQRYRTKGGKSSLLYKLHGE